MVLSSPLTTWSVGTMAASVVDILSRTETSFKITSFQETVNKKNKPSINLLFLSIEFIFKARLSDSLAAERQTEIFRSTSTITKISL